MIEVPANFETILTYNSEIIIPFDCFGRVYPSKNHSCLHRL